MKTATQREMWISFTRRDGSTEVFKHVGDHDSAKAEATRRAGPEGWTGCSTRNWTEPIFTCWMCGNPEHGQWVESKKSELIRQGICFDCNCALGHLQEYLEPSKRPAIAIVDSRFYTIGSEKPSIAHCRGFGGAKFVINFKDGRRVISTNLWDSGTIEPRWRAVLPDNATFEK